MIKALVDFATNRIQDLDDLLSSFLRSSHGEYGAKKAGNGKGLDVEPGRLSRTKTPGTGKRSGGGSA